MTCHQEYPADKTPFRCECGGIFDFDEFPEFYSIDNKNPRLVDFLPSLGLFDQCNIVSLGEGGTPLVSIRRDGMEIFLKMEGINPTGSYKDRGSSVLTGWLVSHGVQFAVEDSSGNAGASFSAYAARAGIRARVFVPESASGPKCQQIVMYGADLIRVPGARSQAARAVLEEAENGVVYASHAWMPFGLIGIATIAYEIVAQLGAVPGTIITPVGHGGLLYGLMRGFQAMFDAGYIHKEPYYIGVQSAGCAPLVEAFLRKTTTIQPVTQTETMAEGVKVEAPSRGMPILQRMLAGKGSLIAIPEENLINAWKECYQTGIAMEPTSALVMAGLFENWKHFKSPMVAVITGSGYKFTISNKQE